ncbi:hypothetical protein SAMD00019534_078550 [Acytostelium subglobosum LB1]|uniref:hypothetical protein n=1 Tax=Acytostelium subglobosum LB1 TaxID=1410327 RepID=UPI00064500D9|nr:hypothetical protein SAMD00019534_078550 [Acytostelium subglobosum LB1]GAM24680.1 hypothetical protein SAMD00019534_078550 [Acytostelium subglobosum LB1]|eukprot:XP_012752349.1 hypothetical protein SAMD00019534_078550 [Acytostelium subglobosum LB1]
MFNTTFLDNDPYSCRTVGQTVVVGNSSFVPGTTTVTQPCPAGNQNPSINCVYTCTQDDLLTADLNKFIAKTVVATIESVIENLIIMPTTASPDVLQLSAKYAQAAKGQCIYGINIPQSYISPGISNIDTLIWVTVRPVAVPTSTVAYALPCNLNYVTPSTFSRPLAGVINFNPRFYNQLLNSANPLSFKEYVMVGLHEMIHALGFTSSLFDSYIDQSTGDTYANGAAMAVTRTGRTPLGRSYSYQKYAVTTPNVVSFVQSHYKCAAAEYAELEDYGGSGTANSHWEKRTAGEELMIGFVNPIAPVSNLTLSLLQDTGWYQINKSNADTFIWGKNLGCDWLNQCSIDTWNYQGYFCLGDERPGCTPTRMGKGMCSVQTYSQSLPTPYQHFNASNEGGFDQISDFCPYNIIFDNVNSNYYCVDQANSKKGDSSVFEFFGTDSRCFEYTKGGSDNIACWQQRCKGTNVEVNIGGQWVLCSSPGATVSINGLTLVCPQGFAECGGAMQKVQVEPSSSISIHANFNHMIVGTTILLLLAVLI